MKMKMQETNLDALWVLYHRDGVKTNGDAVLIRNIGTNKPNIELELPGFKVPIQDGSPINLFEGFHMPEVIGCLNLQDKFVNAERILFCQYIGKRMTSTSNEVLRVRLSDPEDSDIIIYSATTSDQKGFLPRQKGSGCTDGTRVWLGYSFQRRDRMITNIREYFVFPLGYRYLGEGIEQTPEDREQTKAEMIRLANEYLGITDETNDNGSTVGTAGESESGQLMQSPEASQSGVTMVQMPDEPTEMSPDTDRSDLFRIPGFEDFSDQTFKIWTHKDEVGTIDAFAIDRYGRLLAPDFEDCSDLFLDVEFAGFKVWCRVPKDALVLECRMYCDVDSCDAIVHQQNQPPTDAQRARVQLLQRQCTKSCGLDNDGSRTGPNWNLWG